ncbi:carbohydrate kinase [Acidisoma cellulosilytica]|uniref:Carbohydrate kinase n=1 Tax=Acidisoma cellulosilyticum TaxID=2802395 RepID=A0A963Z673_9PROT|nr:FGGY-family carbohydrate kinase [Acidisoma cellulosilyticum]MCB8882597.1 carbohydrate kinase [Acidisoma cellulosilyticum]
MKALLGIDKGTTTTKAVVFAADTGRVLGLARRATPSFRPQPDWHEEDTELTWAGVAIAIRAALADAGLPASAIAAVGVSGHMGGLWALDREGVPFERAIAWPDGRASELLQRWRTSGVVEKVYDISGNALIPGMPIVLLAWMQLNRPDLFRRIGRIFCAKDYVNYRLTGEVATDESDLSFFPCDIRNRSVSEAIFDLCGLAGKSHLIPTVLPIGAPVGRVTAKAAEETGLVEGTPVTSGAGDAVAAAIGAGALLPGQAVTVIGTSFMNNLTVDRPVMEPAGVGFLFLMPNGRWQRLMSNTGGGSICLDWVIDAFGRKESALCEDGSLFARIESEARALPPLPGGLLFHPYLNTSGMTAPCHEPSARGSIMGLGIDTTPMALLRGIMEGVALSMVDCYAAIDAPVNEIRITGGGARSRLWRDICAAAMNRELAVTEAEETGALGVALLAGQAAGLYPTLEVGAAQLVRVIEKVQPNPAMVARYGAAFPLFRDIREALVPAWAARSACLELSARRNPS